MKKYLLHAIGCVCCQLIIGVSQAQNVEGLNLPSTIVRVTDLPAPVSSLRLPFSGITILDQRFDTTKVGYLANGQDYNKFLLPRIGYTLENYLNGHYHWKSGNEPRLLLVLRTFWLTNRKAGEGSEHNESRDTKDIGEVYLKIDAFAQNNTEYRALRRIDTTFLIKAVTKSNAAGTLSDVLQLVMEKFQFLDVAAATADKRIFQASEIDAHYQRQRSRVSEILPSTQRGIFLTFDDFLKNRLRTDPFSLEQGAEADYLYLETGKDRMLFTNFWGFHDGQHLYIRIGSNFFKLIQEQNTYAFMGCRQSIHKSKARSQGRIVRSFIFGSFGEAHQSRLINFLRPMQVNMETGSVY